MVVAAVPWARHGAGHTRLSVVKWFGPPGRPFKVKGEEGKQAVDRWCSWAQRSRLPSFVELSRSIRHRQAIDAALDHGLSNALIDPVSTKIRLITQIAFGFKDPAAPIALALLSLGGYRPPLPGR